MKLNIFVNNYLYTKPDKLINIDIKFVKSIIDKFNIDTIILNGEPTLYPKLDKLLNLIQYHKIILTTFGENIDILYNKKIHYISYKWNGFLNDKLRPNTTNNIVKGLQIIKPDINRINYIITPQNLDTLKIDVEILKYFLQHYQNMKQPYFSFISQGIYYDKFTWIPFSKDHLDIINKKGLLTKKNFEYLNNYVNKKLDQIQCVNMKNEIVINYDNTIRVCTGILYNTKIGIDYIKPFDCEYKMYCWTSSRKV